MLKFPPMPVRFQILALLTLVSFANYFLLSGKVVPGSGDWQVVIPLADCRLPMR